MKRGNVQLLDGNAAYECPEGVENHYCEFNVTLVNAEDEEDESSGP